MNEPAGWAETTIGEVCDVIQGQSPPGTSYNFNGDGLPFFQGKAEFGDLRPTVRKWTTEARKQAIEDDVLLSIRAPVGPTNLAASACAIGRGLAAIRPLGDILPRFALYALRATSGGLAAAATGSTFGAVSGLQVRSHPMPLPPLAEQRRIVAAIEEQFSRLDAANRVLQATALRLEALRRAVLDTTFRAEIRTKTLGEVADTKLGKMLSEKSKVGERPFPYLRNKSVQWYRIDVDDLPAMDFSDSEREKFNLSHGDVLICEGGEVGRAAVWREQLEDCYFQKALHRVRTGSELDPEFLVHVFRWFADRDAFEPYVTGSTIKHLPQEDLRRLPVPLPPLEDQRRIVAELEQQLSLIDSLRAAVESAQKRSAALRRAILERAFRGELVPQDPADGPASVLLERIRAERTENPPTKRRTRAAR